MVIEVIQGRRYRLARQGSRRVLRRQLSLLSLEGRFVVFSPPRAPTLLEFVPLASRRFDLVAESLIPNRLTLVQRHPQFVDRSAPGRICTSVLGWPRGS